MTTPTTTPDLRGRHQRALRHPRPRLRAARHDGVPDHHPRREGAHRGPLRQARRDHQAHPLARRRADRADARGGRRDHHPGRRGEGPARRGAGRQARAGRDPHGGRPGRGPRARRRRLVRRSAPTSRPSTAGTAPPPSTATSRAGRSAARTERAGTPPPSRSTDAPRAGPRRSRSRPRAASPAARRSPSPRRSSPPPARTPRLRRVRGRQRLGRLRGVRTSPRGPHRLTPKPGDRPVRRRPRPALTRQGTTRSTTMATKKDTTTTARRDASLHRQHHVRHRGARGAGR